MEQKFDKDKKHFVYIIECDENRRYIGVSSDVKNRVEAHNKKLSLWTKRFNNWKIIYKKEFKNYSEARKWELYLKRQKGGNKLKEILNNYSGVEQSGSSRGS